MQARAILLLSNTTDGQAIVDEFVQYSNASVGKSAAILCAEIALCYLIKTVSFTFFFQPQH